MAVSWSRAKPRSMSAMSRLEHLNKTRLKLIFRSPNGNSASTSERKKMQSQKNEIAEFGTNSKSENLEFWNFGMKNRSKKLEFLE
jgi:hypothetical protein